MRFSSSARDALMLKAGRCACVLLLFCVAGAAASERDVRLIAAARASDDPAVRALLREGASVRASEPDGTTALHWAVRADDIGLVDLLLHAGADARAANRYGVTPLALAAGNGSRRAIELLLAAGADPSVALAEGETILMTAARTGAPAALDLLLSRGVDPNAADPRYGETALMWAAAENHASAVRRLVGAGARVDARSTVLQIPELHYPRTGFDETSLPRGGWTALMYAARQGAPDAVSALLGVGADVNARDPDGSTALTLAVINAHYDVASALLDAGADPDLTDRTGMSALYALVDMRTLPWIMGRPDPRPTGAVRDLELMERMLARGADPDAVLVSPTLRRQHTDGDPALGQGATPFMRAAKAGDLPAMQLLLKYGADPARRLANGNTALMLAAGFGWRDADDVRDRASEANLVEAIQLCLDRGVGIDVVNARGETALHGAAGRGAVAIARFLIERGAAIDVKSADGRTPLDVAARARGGRGAGVAALLRAR